MDTYIYNDPFSLPQEGKREGRRKRFHEKKKDPTIEWAPGGNWDDKTVQITGGGIHVKK